MDENEIRSIIFFVCFFLPAQVEALAYFPPAHQTPPSVCVFSLGVFRAGGAPAGCVVSCFQMRQSTA